MRKKTPPRVVLIMYFKAYFSKAARSEVDAPYSTIEDVAFVEVLGTSHRFFATPQVNFIIIVRVKWLN